MTRAIHALAASALLALVAASAASLTDEAAGPQHAARARVVLLSVDAGADWVIDELIARGKAPAFAAIAREGASAQAMISVMPTLTAVAHTSLWTGAYPRVHGISGNNVPLLPRSDHTLLEWRSGFDGGMKAEPIWTTAAAAGLHVLVTQATGGFPPTRIFPDRLLLFDIYANCQREIELVTGRLPPAPDEAFHFPIGEMTAALRRGPDDQLILEVAGRRFALRGGRDGAFTPAVPITIAGHEGATRFRLVSHDPRDGRFTLLRGRVCELTSTNPDRLSDFRRAAGTIVGEGIGRFYEQGRFGPTLADGGDGAAEELVADILDANHEYFQGALAFAAQERWDLLVLYVPNLDAASHALVGMLDPASPRYSEPLARRVWPWLERIFATTIDAYVADIRRRFPDATLLIGADHGMEGTGRWVYPNVALRKAGLLAVDAKGRIDVGRTRAAHLPGHAGGIFLNTTDRKEGIVPLEDRRQVKERVVSTLLGIRDAAGAAAIRAVFDADLDGAGLGIGGDAGADLYFDLASGYEDGERATGEVEIEEMPATGSGDHGPAPWRRNLQAIFYAVGPQVGPGVKLGLVRVIDVAPTVSRLLGIPPPADAEGRPLVLR